MVLKIFRSNTPLLFTVRLGVLLILLTSTQVAYSKSQIKLKKNKSEPLPKILRILPTGLLEPPTWGLKVKKNVVDGIGIDHELEIQLNPGETATLIEQGIANGTTPYQSDDKGILRIKITPGPSQIWVGTITKEDHSKEPVHLITLYQSASNSFEFYSNCSSHGLFEIKQTEKSEKEQPIQKPRFIFANCNPYNDKIVVTEFEKAPLLIEAKPFEEIVDTPEFQLNFKPRFLAKWPIQLNSAIGSTYTSYNETTRNLQISEWSLTPKVNLSYRLKNYPITISANSFFGAITLGSHIIENGIKSNTLLPFKTYGINGRVGYQIPEEYLGIKWSISTGPYFWGMLVPDTEYGLKYVVGPQVLIGTQLSDRLSSYFKYSSITEGFGLSIVNAEYALGANYILRRLWNLPLNVSIDMARLSFKGTSIKQAFTMSSITAGVGVNW